MADNCSSPARGADLAVVGVEVERPVYTVLGQPSVSSADELARPLPPPDKYLDVSYWERAWPR